MDTSSEVLRGNVARGPKALVEECFSRLARNIVDINEYWRGDIQQVDDNIELRFHITNGVKFRNDMRKHKADGYESWEKGLFSFIKKAVEDAIETFGAVGLGESS